MTPALRERLRDWYRAERRDLPWRATRDPYAIWLSETMLQQTRVETVAPYWVRFLARFPDVQALAAASVDEVLGLWSGLGYYRRARALHAAAQLIVARHGGRFPVERAELLALPGIGAYTAGAVLSIAFDRPEPAVDGNVARVLSRLFAIDRAPGTARERELEACARALVPRRGAGEWNQALMELGARVCTPREPACARCPVARDCAAHAMGRARELPRMRARPTPVQVELEILLVRRSDALLLERRPAGGRMAGLWQLPTIELVRKGQEPRLFPARHPAHARLTAREPLGSVRHAITCHRIRATVRTAELAGRAPPPLAWIPGRELAALALTGMTKKVLAARFCTDEPGAMLAALAGPASPPSTRRPRARQ